MNSRERLVLLLSVSLLPLLVSPIAVHGDVSSPTATLSSGDWWKYDIQFANLPGAPTLTLTGTLTETLSGKQSINVGGIVYDSFRFDLSGTGSVSGTVQGFGISGTWTITGSDYKLKSDLSDLKSTLSIQINLQAVIPTGSVSITVSVIQSRSDLPPDQTYQFPLTEGESWTSASLESTNTTTVFANQQPVTNSTSKSVTITHSVLSSAIMTVSAGSYQTLLIQARRSPDGSREDNYYSPQVENNVKTIDYNSTGYTTVTWTLSDYGAWVYKTSEPVQMNGKTNSILVATDVAISNAHADLLTLNFQVNGPDGVTGRASITLPKQLNGTTLQVLIDGKTASSTVTGNSTSYTVTFIFPLSNHTITLVYANQTFFSGLLSNFLLIGIIIGAVIVAAVAIVVVLIVRRRTSSATQPSMPPMQTPSPPTGPPPSPPPPTTESELNLRT